MNLTRRSFTTLAALTPALLAACGSGQDEPTLAPEPEPTSPYWITEKVTSDGEDMDLSAYGIDTADYLVLVLNDDGTGYAYAAGEPGGSLTWSDGGDHITINANGQTQDLARDGDRLTYDMPDGSTVTLVNTPDMPDVVANGFDVLAAFSPNFDTAQTTRMSTFCASGRYAADGSTLYGFHYDPESDEPGLAKLVLGMSNDNIKLDEQIMLDVGCSPYYVALKDGYVWYKRTRNGGDEQAICRVPMDGGEVEVVREGAVSYLFVGNDALYFTDADNRYATCALDGTGEEVLIDKKCYYPYPVGSEFVVFQDDADGERLHVFHRETELEAAITEQPTYAPVIDGTVLWCVGEDDAGALHLMRVDLAAYDAETHAFACETAEPEVSIPVLAGAQQLFLGNYAEGERFSWPREEWQSVELRNYDPNGRHVLTELVSPEYEAAVTINESGNTAAIYCNTVGSVAAFPIW